MPWHVRNLYLHPFAVVLLAKVTWPNPDLRVGETDPRLDGGNCKDT